MFFKFLISLIVLSTSSIAFSNDCVDFTPFYRCSFGESQAEYIISIKQDSTAPIASYKVVKTYSDKVESFALVADGHEVQFENSGNYALYRAATCDKEKLTLNLREVTSIAGNVTTGTVSSLYTLMTGGKLLKIESTATITRANTIPAISQTTDFCFPIN